MARRRLLTILAGSALLSATLAGPAAATELIGASQDSVTEVTEATVEVTDEAVDEAAEAVDETVDPVAEEPLDEVAGAVEEAVAPSPSESSSPAPSPTTEEPVAAADSSRDEPSEGLVAAGDVGAAPALAFLTGTGGSAPATQSRLDVPTPAVVPAPPASEEVLAPQVAPAPAEVADDTAASMLAQAASRAVQDEGLPIVVLVAIASLLAAGTATVREARIAA